MFRLGKDIKNAYPILGVKGLPEHYPVPMVDDMLFYIQRNQNTDTIIYQANRTLCNRINLDSPIKIFWQKFDGKCSGTPLSHIQRKLAYGIESKEINNSTVVINLVSYPVYKIYIHQQDDGKCLAMAKIKGKLARLSNVYVFADQTGAFPIVRYLELYGTNEEDQLPCYEKIVIS